MRLVSLSGSGVAHHPRAAHGPRATIAKGVGVKGRDKEEELLISDASQRRTTLARVAPAAQTMEAEFVNLPRKSKLNSL